ncbi:MAG: hypothetical protein H6765_10605 [Candidatus Peribacteria bacterium]|nr:MAG: hypothetical protein H6765_10585 [Candidatus Peribacteria bacterium]USN54881.1 MAG: hypothetical protein H6765_10605 [Candidatus Peribacteria bacterium]
MFNNMGNANLSSPQNGMMLGGTGFTMTIEDSNGQGGQFSLDFYGLAYSGGEFVVCNQATVDA